LGSPALCHRKEHQEEILISSQLVWMMSREEVRAVGLEICESSDTNNGISLFITVLMQRS
jgi:hypothetical protein